MRMIRAIVRPEKADAVVEALAAAGFPAVTKLNVFGRGQQRGLHVGGVTYDELPKVMLMLVVPAAQADRAVDVILDTAYTGRIGDGKVFLSEVTEAYTIRTGERGL